MSNEKDASLVSALRQAKSTPMFFAFVPQGSTDGVLLLSKKKIAASEISAAKAQCGGNLVHRGRCQEQDGKMLFELAREPPSSLARQLRAVIHANAGLTLAVETRVATDLEPADEESPTPPAMPDRVTSRLKALTSVWRFPRGSRRSGNSSKPGNSRPRTSSPQRPPRWTGPRGSSSRRCKRHRAAPAQRARRPRSGSRPGSVCLGRSS
jgi:hypothetical protein